MKFGGELVSFLSEKKKIFLNPKTLRKSVIM